jgi:hypothetical protein
MVKSFKRFGSLCLVLAGTGSAMAFSLLGPIGNGGDDYQTPTLYYGMPGDYGAPKILGEEYRVNIPVLYYAFDANFYDYFGADGVRAVEAAFAIFNNLTNVSAYSADLSEFPLDGQRINFRAQALQLMDVKSSVLGMVSERLGLAQPTRYTWALRERIGTPGCGPPPSFFYRTIMRNFDPVTWEPTRYVNGTRYTYRIFNFCPADEHDAIEVVVDPLTMEFNAVADYQGWLFVNRQGNLTSQSGLARGGFYSTLTRDDIGGLRYLWQGENRNVESLGTDSVRPLTNWSTRQLMISSNLTDLVAAAWTNDAAGLVARYPGLLVLDTQPVYTNTITTNVYAYFATDPWYPAGFQQLKLATNYTTNWATRFLHTFANVITNTYYTQALASVVVSNVNILVAPAPWSPPGQVTTNSLTTNHVTLNMVSGDFFLLPTNSQCGYVVVSTNLPPIVIQQTNEIAMVTNSLGQEYSQIVYTYFTNHAIEIHPVTCETNGTALVEGIEKVRFHRRDYDSLLERFFYPITNTYTLNIITNSTLIPTPVTRRLQAPDILISAADLNFAIALREVAPFNQSNVLARLAGPGIVEMPTTFVLNKVGPMRYNSTTFADEATSIGTNFVWGSFDASTNVPVVYPNSRTILELENQLLMRIIPSADPLPNGKVGVAYPALMFAGQGGQTPYTWSLAPDSPGLPPGLTGLSLAGQPAATISGTPTQAGIFDFIVRLTDTNGRFVNLALTLTIGP